MSDWSSDLEISKDEEVSRNWADLIALLDRPDHQRAEDKEAIDEAILSIMFNWLERRDECGVYHDLVDLALNRVTGTTLGDLAGGADNEDVTLPPGFNLTDFVPEEGAENSAAAAPTPKQQGGGGRNLQFFTEQTCTTFESTIFLGSMLSFSSCADVDIGKFFGTVEENLVNVGLHCLNTFLQPFQRTRTCASRNFQNYVMDQCVQGVIGDDILGHIFQLFLISPKQTCGCMASLAAVPQCRVDVTNQVSLDGQLTSKFACLLQSQVCDKMEDECDHRLGVLNKCLPSMYDLNNDNFDCERVLCNCERNDKGLLNYAGRAMELPMSDMCTDHAADYYQGDFIPARYSSFQEKCGAIFVNETPHPTMAPTVSVAPSMSPTGEFDNLANLVSSQRSNSTANSVISGILVALAITGVAAIFILIVVVLWRNRCRSRKERSKVHSISQMKAHAQDQIKRLEEEVRRMEAQEQAMAEDDSLTPTP